MTPARLVSLAAVLVAAILIYRNPGWTVEGVDWFTRIGLAATLAGLLGALVHGIGFEAQSRPLQVVASPRVAWPAMLAGLALMFLAQRW